MDKVTARLEICTCGKHGRIVFSDGRTGGEFYSQEDAHLAIHYASLAKGFDNVDDQSVRKVVDAIDRCVLPRHDSQVSEYSKKVIRTWNTAKLHNPNLNAEIDFHKIDDRLWHYNPFGD